MMISLVLAATAGSTVFLVLLGLGDPKRRRAARMAGGHDRKRRYIYAIGAAAPGVLIPFTGDAAMWLIWFGSCAVIGWLIALWLGQPRAQGRGNSQR